MKELQSSFFFNLERNPHKELLLKTEFVWDAISQLKEYILSQTLGKIECSIPEGVFLVHPEKISIGEGAIIERGAYIEGPCIIGKNCQIRNGAYLRPYVLIGDQCIIGHSTEIKHSILLHQARAPHFNYIGDSILGNGVNLGAGAICSNVRLDQEEIKIGKEKYPTGLKKLGAIVGDFSQIGCNSVLNPGTLLQKNSLIYPCTIN